MSEKAKKEFIKYAAEVVIDHAPWYVGKTVSETLGAAIYDAWAWYVYNEIPFNFEFNEEELIKSLVEELGFVY